MTDRHHSLRLSLVAASLILGGCSSIGSLFPSNEGGSQIDYRSRAAKTQPLEVPPDLTQLSREGRFQVQAGQPVSASTFGQAPQGAAGMPNAVPVTPQEVGSVKLIREGDNRRLVTALAPEVAYQRALAFWKEAGFTIEVDRPEAGVIETGWAEDRGKLPKDFVRNLIGRMADNLFSSGERDRFRTRIERNGPVTEIVVSHRGLLEGPTQGNRDVITWQPRPTDIGLEAEMTYRLMARLGAPESSVAQARAEQSQGAAPRAAGAPMQPRARALADGRIQLDEGFDRSWRVVGAALDRGGFTVEDRDRAGGIYFVRYVDREGGAKSGMFNRMLNIFRSEDSKSRLARYRIVVKEEAAGKSALTILDSNGQKEDSTTVRDIRNALLKELM